MAKANEDTVREIMEQLRVQERRGKESRTQQPDTGTLSLLGQWMASMFGGGKEEPPQPEPGGNLFERRRKKADDASDPNTYR